jgi:hypothetical protein
MERMKELGNGKGEGEKIKEVWGRKWGGGGGNVDGGEGKRKKKKNGVGKKIYISFICLLGVKYRIVKIC